MSAALETVERDAEERRRLLDAITDRPGRRLAALVTATRIPMTTARRHLRDLVEAGEIWQPEGQLGWHPAPRSSTEPAPAPRAPRRRPMPPNATTPSEAQTEKEEAVLAAVRSAGPGGVRAVDVASSTGVNVSTVYRILGQHPDEVEARGERRASRWHWRGEAAAEPASAAPSQEQTNESPATPVDVGPPPPAATDGGVDDPWERYGAALSELRDALGHNFRAAEDRLDDLLQLARANQALGVPVAFEVDELVEIRSRLAEARRRHAVDEIPF